MSKRSNFGFSIESTSRSVTADLFDLEPPGFPITRTASSVGHGHDLNRRIGDALNYAVRKTAQQVFPCAVQMPRPALRIVSNRADGLIGRRYESIGGGWIALSVPEKGRSRFGHSVRMELNALRSHEIVRGFGAALQTRERSFLFLCPNPQYVAQSPYPMPTRRLHRRRRLNCRLDGRRARRVLPQVDAKLLPQLFYDWTS